VDVCVTVEVDPGAVIVDAAWVIVDVRVTVEVDPGAVIVDAA